MTSKNQRSGSINIAGAGNANGGSYKTVKIAGAGTVNGDVDAENISAAGASKFLGAVETESLKCAGSCSITGNVAAGSASFSGNATLGGAIAGETLKCSGATKIAGAVKVGRVSSSGSLACGNDVEAEDFQARGALEVNGLLNADNVEIVLDSRSSATEIGGTTITIRRKQASGSRGLAGMLKSMKGALGKSQGHLVAASIEGDHIDVSWTSADVVRGRRVVVGPGAEIGRVEYQESLQVDGSAKVNEQQQI